MTTPTPTTRVVQRVLTRLAGQRSRFPGRSYPSDEEAERLVRSVLRDTAAGVELVRPMARAGGVFSDQVHQHRDRSAGANLARLLAAELWGEVEE